MFSLFAGRLKLRFDLISRQWIADVIVGPKKEHSESLELGTQDLQVAKDSAFAFYKQFKAMHATSSVTCWDCQQYKPRQRLCDLGVPECRQTGGKFAQCCDLYLPIKD
jgi:hypothetical protein